MITNEEEETNGEIVIANVVQNKVEEQNLVKKLDDDKIMEAVEQNYMVLRDRKKFNKGIEMHFPQLVITQLHMKELWQITMQNIRRQQWTTIFHH